MKKGQIYSKFEVPEIFQTIQVRRAAEGKGKPFDVEEIFDHKFKEGKSVIILRIMSTFVVYIIQLK